MVMQSLIIACIIVSLLATQQVAQSDNVKGTLATNPFKFGKYNYDQLSAEDVTAFKSKSPEYWRAENQTTTLKQVLMVHRHGDRTPITFSDKDQLRDESFWKFHGLGQLTNRGKARLSMLGEIVRMRYDDFFGKSVSKHIRKSRSSGGLRCIESAQVFLATFLGLNRSDGPDARDLRWDRQDDMLAQIWQPAAINTVAGKVDGMLYEGSECMRITEEYDKINQSKEYKQMQEDFVHERKLLRDLYNFEIDDFYKWMWAYSFLGVEMSYMAAKIDYRIRDAIERLKQASDKTFVLYQSTKNMKRFRGGLLINDMLSNMKAYRKVVDEGSEPGLFDKKFVHYSTHDLNVAILLGILDNMDKYPFGPDYAANVIIELHHDQDEWFVKFFYMYHVPGKYEELHIPACEAGNPKDRCTLDKFDQTVTQYKVGSWQKWMQECGNDLSKANPYDENS